MLHSNRAPNARIEGRDVQPAEVTKLWIQLLATVGTARANAMTTTFEVTRVF